MRKRVLWSKVTARSHKFDQISSELVHKRPGTPAELAEEYRACASPKFNQGAQWT